jgi:hypothetical protein
MFKKIVISLFIVAMFLSPFSVQAQMTNEDLSAQITAQIETLRQQLIAELIKQITFLQTQLSEMIKAQNYQTVILNQQTETINNQGTIIQSQDETLRQIVLNTTPPIVVIPEKVKGCMDKTAKNYNSLAEIDEGCVAWPELAVECIGIGKNMNGATGYSFDFSTNVSGGNGSYRYYWDGIFRDVWADVLNNEISHGTKNPPYCNVKANVKTQFYDMTDSCFGNHPILTDKTIDSKYFPIWEAVIVKSGNQIKGVECVVTQ